MKTGRFSALLTAVDAEFASAPIVIDPGVTGYHVGSTNDMGQTGEVRPTEAALITLVVAVPNVTLINGPFWMLAKPGDITGPDASAAILTFPIP